MKLIVGLGNPGRKYKTTRHNIGFIVIDELKRHISKENAILLKPTTYMNNSGKEVRTVITKSQIPNPNLVVVHDDVDLPFGTIRTSENSSSAGHKGVQSIINEIGSQNFIRIRIGIRPQNQDTRHKIQDTNKFVLEKFTKEEKKQLKQIIKQAVEEIKKILAPNPASERQIFSQK